MELSEYIALQAGAEILEEIEEEETKDWITDIPDDYDESATASEDDGKFVHSLDEYDLKQKWAWYKRPVPDKVLQILKLIKEEGFYNLGPYNRIINDLYARSIYELYLEPGKSKEFLSKVANRYFDIVDAASVEKQMMMLEISRRDYNRNNDYADYLTWPLVRGITWPMAEIFGYDLEQLDEQYLEILLDKLDGNDP